MVFLLQICCEKPDNDEYYKALLESLTQLKNTTGSDSKLIESEMLMGYRLEHRALKAAVIKTELKSA